MAPPYSIYTLFSLKHTFMAGGTLLVAQFFVLFLVKMVTSPDFRKRGHYTNKLLHLIENTNIATPFCDWDEGEYSVQEYKKRFRSTIKEMVATFIVNTIVTGVMMVPLWFTGNPILSRLLPTIIFFLNSKYTKLRKDTTFCKDSLAL